MSELSTCMYQAFSLPLLFSTNRKKMLDKIHGTEAQLLRAGVSRGRCQPPGDPDQTQPFLEYALIILGPLLGFTPIEVKGE